jgi:hypothetical protein
MACGCSNEAAANTVHVSRMPHLLDRLDRSDPAHSQYKRRICTHMAQPQYAVISNEWSRSALLCRYYNACTPLLCETSDVIAYCVFIKHAGVNVVQVTHTQDCRTSNAHTLSLSAMPFASAAAPSLLLLLVLLLST